MHLYSFHEDSFLGLIVFFTFEVLLHTDVLSYQQGYYAGGYFPDAEPEQAGSSSLFDDEAVRKNTTSHFCLLRKHHRYKSAGYVYRILFVILDN